MKKVLLVFSLLFLFPFVINAKEVSNVDYKITDYYVQSDIDIAGALNVKELFVLDGSFNGFSRSVKWKNEDLPKFTGKDKDFYGSSIYNGNDIANLKVGSVKLSKDVKFDDLFNKVTYYEKGTNLTKGNSGKYSFSKNDSGANIKIFNPNTKGKVGFYLEYTITNVSVKHKDVAEFYYNFIGKDFETIDNLEIRTFFPDAASDEYKIWAHGPLNGSIAKIEGNLGSVLKCNNLPAKTQVDVRMTYDTEMYPISLSKNTKINALDKILKVESQRAKDANNKRKINNAMVVFVNVLAIFYFVFLVLITIYIYFKYDKELKSKFNLKYNREIIEDYPVETVDYIMNGKISDKAFVASLLNLIYKKKIKVKKLDNKENYEFTLVSKKNLSDNEKRLVVLLFDFVGNKKKFTTFDLKDNKDEVGFYNKYEEWKINVLNEAKNEMFYFTNYKFRGACVIYSLISLLLLIIGIVFKVNSVFVFIDVVLTILFLIYIFSFKKRTIKGNEDFHKWKAFKNFLSDFGRFDEKELPEVELWEKLLVYATVLGIAKEVSKAMKIKFQSMNPNYINSGNDFFIDYMLYRSFFESISSSVSKNITAGEIMATELSDAKGEGGGFSSGAGSGGGGGGAHGF